MATTKQEPSLPEQPKVQPAPAVGGQHLDSMQGVLNLLFMQSGRFIKEHQSGGGTGRMRLSMERAAQVTQERFQDSLDQLENEIRLAQVVLRRDMALMKQDRKKKQEAAAKQQQEAEKARLAAANKPAEVAQPEAMEIDKNPVPAPAPAKPELVTAENEPEKKLEPEQSTTKDKEETKNVPAPIDTTAALNREEERDPLFDGTPTTANPDNNDFDFDAMFGDAMEHTGGDNSQSDMMDTSGNMDFNFDEGPSLLRGLEDFAKDSDDTTVQNSNDLNLDMDMPDLPDLNAPPTPQTEPPAPAKVEETTPKATTQPPQEPATTTTAPADDVAKTEDPVAEDSMDMMDSTNFDDLFNMDDEYPNPEASAFDDAFFDFEN